MGGQPQFLGLPLTSADIPISHAWFYSDDGSRHRGIDYAYADIVLAPASGWAVRSYRPDFGNLIYLAHTGVRGGKTYYSLVAHLCKDGQNLSIPFMEWDQIAGSTLEDDFTGWFWVDAAEPLGVAGATGRSEGVHLHLEVHRGAPPFTDKIDPYDIYGSLAGGRYPDDCGPSNIWIGCPPDIAQLLGQVLLFEDNFNDNYIDPSKWIISRDRVIETNGEFRVETKSTDWGGLADTTLISIDRNRTLVFSRKVKVHYSNNYSSPALVFNWPGYPDHRFIVSYSHYRYRGGNSCPQFGFVISRNGAGGHSCDAMGIDISEPIAPIWDQWFDERIVYNPTTGSLDYYINDVRQLSYNVGVLPVGADSLYLHFNAWGWWTGHYQHMEDLVVSQE